MKLFQMFQFQKNFPNMGSLNISEYVTNDPISDNIKDPMIQLTVKYRKHPRIITIGEVWKEGKEKYAFSFSLVAKEEIFRDILNLDVSKSCQDTDILSKNNKENAVVFASFLHSSFITSITDSEFPSVLKQAEIIKENADIFACFLHSIFNTSVTNSEFPSVLKQATGFTAIRENLEIRELSGNLLNGCFFWKNQGIIREFTKWVFFLKKSGNYQGIY